MYDIIDFCSYGKNNFHFYAITIHAFKIAGGILFLRIGLNMLEAKVSRTKSTPKESEEALESNTDIALSPIGIPLIISTRSNNISYDFIGPNSII